MKAAVSLWRHTRRETRISLKAARLRIVDFHSWVLIRPEVVLLGQRKQPASIFQGQNAVPQGSQVLVHVVFWIRWRSRIKNEMIFAPRDASVCTDRVHQATPLRHVTRLIVIPGTEDAIAREHCERAGINLVVPCLRNLSEANASRQDGSVLVSVYHHDRS